MKQFWQGRYHLPRRLYIGACKYLPRYHEVGSQWRIIRVSQKHHKRGLGSWPALSKIRVPETRKSRSKKGRETSRRTRSPSSAAIFKEELPAREGILLTYNKNIILCCSCGTQDAACWLSLRSPFASYDPTGARDKGTGNFANCHRHFRRHRRPSDLGSSSKMTNHSSQ